MGRRFGQHFLQSERIVERIADAVCRSAPAHVLEIGPGRGALTAKLLERGLQVTAFEIDPAMVATLSDRFGAHPNLKVRHQDVLQADLAATGATVIAGNLPFYITSPILRKVFAARRAAAEAVLMTQREVADRLVAKPGSRDYGLLSVVTQVYSDPAYLFTVKPGAFRPPPKVESAVVLLKLQQDSPDDEEFLSFVGRCFAQKRKTMRNNLLPFYGRSADELPEARLRAEQLSVERLRDIWKRLTTDTYGNGSVT